MLRLAATGFPELDAALADLGRVAGPNRAQLFTLQRVVRGGLASAPTIPGG
jgi:hypothetical protein